MLGVEERPRRAEVARFDDGRSHRPVIRVELRDAVARRAAERIVRDDDVRALLSDQPRRGLRERRTAPGQLAVEEVQERQP